MLDSDDTKQMSLSADGFERKIKRARKAEFLDVMNLVVPCAELVALIVLHAPPAKRPGLAPAGWRQYHFAQALFAAVVQPAGHGPGTGAVRHALVS